LQSSQLLARHQIDDQVWDQTITDSINRRIYGYTWYLDAVTDGKWSALIIGNYDFIMPLVHRSKCGISYIYQPFITQQLGVFGLQQCTGKVLGLFLKSIPWKYHIVDMNIMECKNSISRFFIQKRQNHIIDLSPSYQAISKNYNRNTRRNIKSATDASLTINLGIDTQQFIDFQSQWEPGDFTAPNRHHVEQLVTAATGNADVIVGGVFDGSELVATGLFIIDNQRVWFLLCASNEKGKDKKAMFFLIDHILQRYATNALIFDFTGSNIPSIIQRNHGFGAVIENFYYIRRKSLLSKIKSLL